MITVVVPTLTGREESLERTLNAYEETLADADWELIVVRDKNSWPLACNTGYDQSKGDVIHFGADDLVPLPGWWQETLAFLAAKDELPAARVFSYTTDGPHENVDDGVDGQVTWFTRVPIFRRDQYERVGHWPLLTYYADTWVSDKARSIGIETRMLFSYAFVHHWSQIKRVDSQKNLDHAWIAYNALRRRLKIEAMKRGIELIPSHL